MVHLFTNRLVQKLQLQVTMVQLRVILLMDLATLVMMSSMLNLQKPSNLKSKIIF